MKQLFQSTFNTDAHFGIMFSRSALGATQQNLLELVEKLLFVATYLTIIRRSEGKYPSLSPTLR